MKSKSLWCLYLYLCTSRLFGFTMISFGDSITEGVNAGGFGTYPQYNWSTGFERPQEVNSHFFRLQKKGFVVDALNVAESGATSYDLSSQLKDIGDKVPDYATIFIGGNDICRWEEDHTENIRDYEENIRNTMDSLVSLNSQVKMLVVPIPDMLHLYNMGKNQGCQWKWNMMRVCSRLLSSKRSHSERLLFQSQIKEANAKLVEIVGDYEHAKIDPTIFDVKFTWDHVSHLDCFHPSLAGQNLIAEKTWQDNWLQVKNYDGYEEIAQK
jgi:lysophospholipase L1-like esterase